MPDLTHESKAPRLTATQWLICAIAAIGFAFDIYELLMMPLIGRPALGQLLGVDPYTDSGANLVQDWYGRIQFGSAICGGLFGLLGGYLTDIFGRRRVLVWSILLYAFSAFAAGFSTSVWMLFFFRCTTFIGVCVEFVAAVAWLAELFPNPKQREAVLGYTQAFSSLGGLLLSGLYIWISNNNESLPEIMGGHAIWRYTLISGLVPALPLLIIRPFLPESPVWAEKRAKGTLKRPSLLELFQPAFRRTTIVTTIMFACSYGAAFGAIQFAPQIVPGLVPGLEILVQRQKDYESEKQAQAPPERLKDLTAEIKDLRDRREAHVGRVQFYQEIGGLLGRCALAYLAIRILSRGTLLRIFQVPGLIIVPLVFFFPARSNLEWFQWGIAAAGFFTVAQFSFWGNYLPRVYPVHIRGTGESFAANVGGRMLGTMAVLITPLVAKSLVGVVEGKYPFPRLAVAAAIVGFGFYAVGLIASFFLPEPPRETVD